MNARIPDGRPTMGRWLGAGVCLALLAAAEARAYDSIDCRAAGERAGESQGLREGTRTAGGPDSNGSYGSLDQLAAHIDLELFQECRRDGQDEAYDTGYDIGYRLGRAESPSERGHSAPQADADRPGDDRYEDLRVPANDSDLGPVGLRFLKGE